MNATAANLSQSCCDSIAIRYYRLPTRTAPTAAELREVRQRNNEAARRYRARKREWRKLLGTDFTSPWRTTT